MTFPRHASSETHREQICPLLLLSLRCRTSLIPHPEWRIGADLSVLDSEGDQPHMRGISEHGLLHPPLPTSTCGEILPYDATHRTLSRWESRTGNCVDEPEITIYPSTKAQA